MSFSSQSTTDDVLEGVRLDGSHAVITGATGGLGIETARALASAGADVTIIGRSADKLTVALETLRGQVPGATFHGAQIDLASLASIGSGTQQLSADGAPIDLLINNAGVMMCPEGTTADGFETQFGTNHLGHFALTAGLLASLNDGARVVTLSSAAHLRCPCDLDDLNWQSRPYDPIQAYGHSKTANIWFASELQRRFGERLLSLSVHPGVIQTDLGRHMSPEILESMRAQFEARGMTPKTVPQGAATSVWAATSPTLAEHGGAYLLDCQIAEPISETNSEGHAPWAYDDESAARLWAASEQLTGITPR